MAACLRLALMLAAGVALSGGGTPAWSAVPVDSAYTPASASGPTLKPAATGNYSKGRVVVSPFVLGRGNANVNNMTGTSCPDANNPLTNARPALCIVEVVSESGMAARSNGVCPIGFAAKLLVKPQNSVPGAQPVACVRTEPIVDDTTSRTIKFTVYVGASPKESDMTYQPGTSFNWEIQCYPNINTSTSNDAHPLTEKTPSSLGECENNVLAALPVLLWDQGFIVSLTDGGGSFLTNRKCPFGYAHNVFISGPSIFNHNFSDTALGASAHVPTGGGACITGVTEPSTSPSQYSVAYLYKSHSVKLDTDAAGKSISVQFPTSTSGALQNFKWELFCYPPGYSNIPNNIGGSCSRSSSGGATPFR